MWDHSSLTRDRTSTPCIGRQSLNHWTTREVPSNFNMKEQHTVMRQLKVNISSLHVGLFALSRAFPGNREKQVFLRFTLNRTKNKF